MSYVTLPLHPNAIVPLHFPAGYGWDATRVAGPTPLGPLSNTTGMCHTSDYVLCHITLTSKQLIVSLHFFAGNGLDATRVAGPTPLGPLSNNTGMCHTSDYVLCHITPISIPELLFPDDSS